MILNEFIRSRKLLSKVKVPFLFIIHAIVILVAYCSCLYTKDERRLYLKAFTVISTLD